MLFYTVVGSIADPNPDPPDPHVFRPPGSGSTSQIYGSGSGSGSFYHHAKIVRKTLIPRYYFVTFFDFLSLKNDVNVPSKSNKQKKLCSKSNFLLASGVSDENRIRPPGSGSESGSGSIGQRHGSADPDPHQNVMDPQHCLSVPYIVVSFCALKSIS
jgi:hypothetical protein